MTGIDTTNSQLVGARVPARAVRSALSGDHPGDVDLVVMVSAPMVAMTADDALRHAAWLVAIAEPYASHPFADVLKAVQST